MYYYNYCCLYLTNNSLVSGSTQITFITGAAKSFFIVVQISARFGHSLVLCSSWLFESPPLASLIICIINPLDNLALNSTTRQRRSILQMLEIQMQFVMPIIWQLGHTKKTSSSYHQCATRWLASNPRICRHTHKLKTVNNGLLLISAPHFFLQKFRG